jgi:hypothetical protein
MGARVVHRDHGHAGNRAEAAREPVAVGGRVQPYHMTAGADLAVYDRAAVIARRAPAYDEDRTSGSAADGESRDGDQLIASLLRGAAPKSVSITPQADQ